MDTQILPASEAEGHRPPVTSHESPVTVCKLFSFTHFRKNASATPLVSHTFKTKDLKPFRFTHFQKKGGGWLALSNIQPQTSNLSPSLTDHPARMVVPSEHRESRDLSLYVSPLDSALTSKRAPKSFTSNTYEKHTGGEGVHLLSTLDCQLTGFLYLINLLYPPFP